MLSNYFMPIRVNFQIHHGDKHPHDELQLAPCIKYLPKIQHFSMFYFGLNILKNL
jgi:hypothetical protein